MMQNQNKAGDFLRSYKPKTNINTIIHSFYKKRVAFLPNVVIQTEAQFPDVSFYQGDIDFDVMKLYTNAIFLRAGQGTYKDEKFDRNYAEAIRVGFVVGVYWFYDDRYDPRKQAEALIRAISGKTLKLGIATDWETYFGGQFKGLPKVVSMMQLIDNLGYEIGMYTGYYWFRENSNPVTNAGQYAYLKNKFLWEGWYTNNPANVLVPAPWLHLTHWQWGTPAVAWGQQSKEIDMNFFNGTQQEFDTRYGTGEPEPMTDYMELKSNVSTEWRSVRNQTSYPQVPHIIGSSIGRLDINGIAKANPTDFYEYQTDVTYNGLVQARAGDKWWKVFEVNGSPLVGWMAEIHLGRRYLDTRLVVVNPPTTHTVEVYVDGVLEYRKEF